MSWQEISLGDAIHIKHGFAFKSQYFSLVYGVDQLRSRAVGAVFDAIVRDTFKQIPFVVPDDKILKAFLEHLSPIIQQIDALSTQSRSLAKARDLLLPKLMSGELVA